MRTPKAPRSSSRNRRMQRWRKPRAWRAAGTGRRATGCASVSRRGSCRAAPARCFAPRAGCRVALGADGAACNNRLDMFAEMRLAALIQKPRLGADALPAGKVLELATLGGARALGLEDEIGTIAVGRRADLVVMDLHGPHVTPDGADPVSHLVYAACSSDVRDVFVDGRPVVLGHELVTAPAEEIVREAGRSARELRRLARLA